MMFKVKGPTVMPSLLGFDGGGVRGIVALVLARRLQDALDVPHSFWEFFHSVVGTSVGGVIALDLIVHRSSLSDSLARFRRWVTQIFPVQPYRCLPHCQKLRDLLIWLIRDSKYDSHVLETVMQQAFGQTERLFEASSQCWSGVRLGIMATAASTSQLCIFTNYNGQGDRQRDTGYQVLRPTNVAEEPFVWEVAGVTVAAPGYLRPKEVKGFGLLQDGGLRANNPIEAGLWELSSIWPGHARPGLVLSVGTGYQGSPAHELGSGRGFWADSFMPRIVRAFLSSPCLHGQNSWKSLLNRVDEAARDDFFRLNLEFDEEEPALDDVTITLAVRPDHDLHFGSHAVPECHLGIGLSLRAGRTSDVLSWSLHVPRSHLLWLSRRTAALASHSSGIHGGPSHAGRQDLVPFWCRRGSLFRVRIFPATNRV